MVAGCVRTCYFHLFESVCWSYALSIQCLNYVNLFSLIQSRLGFELSRLSEHHLLIVLIDAHVVRTGLDVLRRWIWSWRSRYYVY